MDLKAALKGSATLIDSAAPAPMPLPPAPPIKVLICIPSGRTWEARCATAVSGLCAYSAMQGLNIGIVGLEGSVIAKQRNDLVQMAQQHGMDYMLQIDSDMVFPPDALVRLLKHGKDVVGATYNKRVAPYATLGKLYGEPPEDPIKNPLCKAQYLPGGMMLFKVSVFDKLKRPYYHESFSWEGETGFEAFKNYVRANYMEDVPEEALEEIADSKLAQWMNKAWAAEKEFMGAQYRSEDINLCIRLRKANVEIWADLSLTFELKHLGTLEVTCLRPEDKALIVNAAM